MRRPGPGHALFAATFAVLGAISLIHGTLSPLWDPIPDWVPARQAAVYLSAFISLASGIGLLAQRTAAPAARLLLACLLFWMGLFRLPELSREPLFAALWPIAVTAVFIAAAWALLVRFATDWDRQRLGFAAGAGGIRIARALYALAVIFFGAAHFIDPADTLVLIPGWLPWHLFWAYFFGCTFIAAGAAVLIGVYARLAAALCTVQIALFLCLVWIPIVAAPSPSAFQWSETMLSWALMAAAWVVTDSYRATPWFAVSSSGRGERTASL
jgi:uncharacterized membrane protein